MLGSRFASLSLHTPGVTGCCGHLPTYGAACGFSRHADQISGLEDRKWHFEADRLGKGKHQ